MSRAFTQDWQDWHRSHEERRADPHGFLAVTQLHWLTDEPQPLADAPGRWSTGSDGVVVTLTEGEELIVDGQSVRGRHSFGVIPERASVLATWHDAVIEIAKRGGHDIIRPRHPNAPILANYQGTPAFAPDPDYVVTGRFEPFDEPRPTAVGAAVAGLEHVYQAPGRVTFTLHGQQLALTVFDAKAGALMALFTDGTSGVTTYAANRVLTVVPDAEGNVRLDFNRAVNLPCAYTPLATCPLPPSENRLPIAIEAGEQTPHEARQYA